MLAKELLLELFQDLATGTTKTNEKIIWIVSYDCHVFMF